MVIYLSRGGGLSIPRGLSIVQCNPVLFSANQCYPVQSKMTQSNPVQYSEAHCRAPHAICERAFWSISPSGLFVIGPLWGPIIVCSRSFVETLQDICRTYIVGEDPEIDLLYLCICICEFVFIYSYFCTCIRISFLYLVWLYICTSVCVFVYLYPQCISGLDIEWQCAIPGVGDHLFGSPVMKLLRCQSEEE